LDIFCEVCEQVYYCSEACRDQAFLKGYHNQVECSALR
jgi:hypothetical protein